MMQESIVSAQGKPRVFQLVFGIYFLGLCHTKQKRSLINTPINNWLNLACTKSLNLCQGRCLH